jgi:integrase/recombinase XerD
MISRDLLDSDPTAKIEWPKRRKGLPRPLSMAELRKLVASLAVPDDLDERKRWIWLRKRWIWLRNRCFIFLMLFGGLRISEAAAVLWKFVDLEIETLTIVDGKGGKDRVIPLHPVLLGELRIAAAERGAKPSPVGVTAGR